MNLKVVTLFIVSLKIAEGLDLPQFFTKCKKSDPDLGNCIKDNIQKGWKQFAEGDNTYHIQRLNPLAIPFMQVRVDANLYGNLTNGQIIGMDDAKFKEVKIDLEKKRFECKYDMPFTSIAGDYDISGKLLGLPIGGEGKTNVTFVNAEFYYYFTYNLTEKRGKHYINIIETKIDYEDIERVYFNLEFLNNNLGETISNVLNENWRELNREIPDSVGLAMGEVLGEILRAFFKKVAYEDFFATE